MASGHVNRVNRPNTWLHRPMLQREESPCQPGAVHTWHIAAPDVCDRPQLAKTDTAFQGAPVGQPTEPLAPLYPRPKLLPVVSYQRRNPDLEIAAVHNIYDLRSRESTSRAT